MKKPAVPVVMHDFAAQQKEVAFNLGMPNFRIQYFRGPVWGKTNEQIRKQVMEGGNPITGRPVMQELVENLTRPLAAEERRTGEVKKDLGPGTYTGTPEELQKLFLEKRYTDFLPVELPTEEKVAEMLKSTSREPGEVLGRMNPGSEAGETWTYTVKTAAINAVMAGAAPEYFPVILALGSTGMTAVNVSDNGFMAGAVINGEIRDEIGLNYEEGAVGPYAHANTTIGRAWSLLSINGGNCGKVGTTYMGTIGNPMNLIGIIMAENEEKSPFRPLSVRRGFRKGENVVTLFMGWGILSAKNWAATVWGPNMNYPEIIKEIYGTQDGWLFGTCAVLSPPIANFVRDAGYDTVEKFTEWVTGRPPGAKPAVGGNLNSGIRNAGGTFTVIVTGGSNNNYFSMGGMVPSRSVQIDEWR
ncbi:MAG: hypothetical protein JW793_10350 [Acidobacteria bacterium]|nr:hypothetical protein [Acidobacteriota bacterium]